MDPESGFQTHKELFEKKLENERSKEIKCKANF